MYALSFKQYLPQTCKFKVLHPKKYMLFNASEWEFRKRWTGLGVGHSSIRRKLAEMVLLTPSHSLTQACTKLHSLCYSLLVWEVFSHFRSQEVMLLLISPAHLDLCWLRTQRPGKAGTKVKCVTHRLKGSD